MQKYKTSVEIREYIWIGLESERELKISSIIKDFCIDNLNMLKHVCFFLLC